MRIASIKSTKADRTLTDLPVTITQHTSQMSLVADAVFLAFSGLAFALPAGLFAAEAMAAPIATQSAITSKPVPAVLTFVGLIMLLIPIVFLIRRLATGFGGTRQIVLTKKDITVSDQSLGRAQGWTAKLSEFKGLTHHVRTSLSQTRNETILVHPDPRKTVLLSISDIDQDTQSAKANKLPELAELLDLPVIPASHLYRLPGLSAAT
ncbi:MAG: hypothetical protein ACRBCJ_01445 [Hyphomicrobiaceae bacterium]